MRMGGSDDCVLLWNWGWDWGIRSVGTERAEGEEMNHRRSTWLSYRSDLLAESACWIWDNGAAAGFLLQSLGWTRGLYFEGGGSECLQMAYLFPGAAQLVWSQGVPVGVGCRDNGMSCGRRVGGRRVFVIPWVWVRDESRLQQVFYYRAGDEVVGIESQGEGRVWIHCQPTK